MPAGFDLDAGVSSVAGPPFEHCSAQASPEWLSVARLGMYRLASLQKSEVWTWQYRGPDGLDKALGHPLNRTRKVLIPLFGELEPLLTQMRSHARG